MVLCFIPYFVIFLTSNNMTGLTGRVDMEYKHCIEWYWSRPQTLMYYFWHLSGLVLQFYIVSFQKEWNKGSIAGIITHETPGGGTITAYESAMAFMERDWSFITLYKPILMNCSLQKGWISVFDNYGFWKTTSFRFQSCLWVPGLHFTFGLYIERDESGYICTLFLIKQMGLLNYQYYAEILEILLYPLNGV